MKLGNRGGGGGWRAKFGKQCGLRVDKQVRLGAARRGWGLKFCKQGVRGLKFHKQTGAVDAAILQSRGDWVLKFCNPRGRLRPEQGGQGLVQPGVRVLKFSNQRGGEGGLLKFSK